MTPDRVWLSALDEHGVGACVVTRTLDIRCRNREGDRLLRRLGVDSAESRIRSLGGHPVSSVEDSCFPDRLSAGAEVIACHLCPVSEGDESAWLMTLVSQRPSPILTDLIQSLAALGKIGDLASSIAHRFNNTLTVVLGQAELLATRLTLDDQAQASVESIRGQGKVASKLASQILSVGRDARPTIPDLSQATAACLQVLRTVSEVQLCPARIQVHLHLGHLYRTLQCLTTTVSSMSTEPMRVSLSLVRFGYARLPVQLIETPVPWAELTIQAGGSSDQGEPQSVLTDDEALDGLPTTLKRFGAHLFKGPSGYALYLPVIDPT